MEAAVRQLAVTQADEVVDAELVDDGAPAGAVAVHTDRDRHLSPETVAAIEASAADSTRRAYGTDRAAFTTWCAGEGRTTVPA
ncbi:integrase, partial [Streptomyces sp. 13-12-16]